MKSKKKPLNALSLDKFEIASIEKLHLIIGGNDTASSEDSIIETEEG